MADATEAYKKHQLTCELREKLMEALKKNASLRATRIALESKLEKIVSKLKANDGVTEILNDPRYEKIELRESRSWLKDIEHEVASSHKKVQGRTRKIRGAGESSNARLTKDAKMGMVMQYLETNKAGEVSLREIADSLGVNGQATTWFKGLDIPAEAIVDKVPGNKRAGKILLRAKVVGGNKKH
jgi:hypothetical protein